MNTRNYTSAASVYRLENCLSTYFSYTNSRTLLHILVFCLNETAIVGYCSSSSAPVLANANTPTPYTTVYSTTSYTCDLGFQSTGPTAPYMTCNPSSLTSGVWTITYSCSCMQPVLILLFVVCFVLIYAVEYAYFSNMQSSLPTATRPLRLPFRTGSPPLQ